MHDAMSDNTFPDDDVPAATGVQYAGFWIRVVAALIDTVLIMAIAFPLLIAIYGWAYFGGEQTGMFAGPADVLISWVAPALATIAFWLARQATPGKMAVSLKVVDARTGQTLSRMQSVVRYLGYYVSMLPLMLGIFWIGLDKRKQGWHDKMAGTVVIKAPRH